MSPRTLLVTALAPYPPSGGGVQRTQLLLRALRRLGEVETAVVRQPRPADADDARQFGRELGPVSWNPPAMRGEIGAWRFIRALQPRLVDRLAHNLGRKEADYQPDSVASAWTAHAIANRRFDLIVGRHLRPTVRTGALRAGVPVIVDIDDLDTEVYRSRLGSPETPRWQRPIIQRHLRQLERLQPKLMRQADHVFIASELDRPLVDHPSVSVLPNIPFLEEGRSLDDLELPVPSPDCSIALTVGSMTHPPNVMGIDFLASAVWPRVRAKHPGAILRIVGSKMAESYRKRWSAIPGVEPVGFVEELADAYRDCAFTISPVFEGGGTKIKVLESLAFGRAAVVTPHSHRGYERTLPDGDAVLVGESAEELAERCVRLFTDAPLRDALAQQGQRKVREQYSFDRFCQVVTDAVTGVLARSSSS